MSTGRVIAVDFDDVLVATNQAAADWHNREHGTSMVLGDFLYYHWWKNPGWGTIDDTVSKVGRFYDSEDFAKAQPIHGALQGCKQLRNKGFKLVIVTARSDEHRKLTEEAVERLYPNIFDGIYFAIAVGKRGSACQSKAQILREVGAAVLIDDSLDNGVECAQAGFQVVLFGQYEWSKRSSKVFTPKDRMGFIERQQSEKPASRWWEASDIPESSFPHTLRRASTWDLVVKLIEDMARG